MNPSMGRIAPERWPTERPLFALLLVASLLVWILLVVSIFGIVYAVALGLFFFVSQMAFVAYVRGSGVRLGPDQFPAIHRRVVDLARAMDMEPPAAYLLQAGGTLNAFATRFARRDLIVLYSDLLEACGDNEGARDMIIAHELGHVRCGHLRWLWLILPGYFVPFLGSAYARAREYTCDRFGLAGAGSPADAVLGLTILSAGGQLAPSVNLRAFVRQREDLNTGLMTLGEWFGSHPPLSKRIAALDASLSPGGFHPARGRALALGILALAVAGVGGGSVVGVRLLSRTMQEVRALGEDADPVGADDGFAAPDPALASARVGQDFARISAFIDHEWAGGVPESLEEVQARWVERTDDVFPTDPFDGFDYGFDRTSGGYRLWSSGPDGEPRTEDDVEVEGGVAASR
jgi:Zn-dependent protease with chaperone function